MATPAKKGFYRQEIQKTTWDVPVRYTGLIPVGSGAYGTVCGAIDQRTKEKVAIKKLYRPFQSLIHAKRAYRELRLLRHIQHENAKRYIQALPPQVKRNFREAFPNMDKKVVDLLEKMLVLDPDRRLSAREGLSHRYLEEYHNPESEPDSMPYDDSFENLELPVEEWRSLIHMEIMTFDPDNPRQTAT
ncbi:UNVERIFIED_CONTAM: hypothetical protein FKN15_030271 [Acipenser sinensis]